MNVAFEQLDAHIPAVMSEQLSLFRHWAQVLSGVPQLASHENPDEFRLQEMSLSQASLQLALEPQPASATPSAARHPIHQLFTSFSPFALTRRPRAPHFPSPSRLANADALHPHLGPPGGSPRTWRGETDPLL